MDYEKLHYSLLSDRIKNQIVNTREWIDIIPAVDGYDEYVRVKIISFDLEHWFEGLVSRKLLHDISPNIYEIATNHDYEQNPEFRVRMIHVNSFEELKDKYSLKGSKKGELK